MSFFGKVPRLAIAGVVAAIIGAWAVAQTVCNDGEFKIVREAQIADIHVVRTQYLPQEMAYAPSTRRLAEAKLTQLEQQAGHLSPAGFKVGLAMVGALADNAHSGLRLWEAGTEARRRLPVRLLWLSEDLIIARAFGDYAELAGAVVLQVEGHSPAALYEASKVLLGGNGPARKHWLNDWLESEGILHALGLAASPDKVVLRLRLSSGAAVERVLPMAEVSEMSPLVGNVGLWSPVAMPGESGWVAALNARELPLYLQSPELPFRTAYEAENELLYVQFRWNQDDGEHRIDRFLEDVSAEIVRRKPRALVVDHRFNVGGNLLTTLPFMRALPGAFDGPIYLLVGHYTFSAGIISAAALKKAGGDQVIVIGDDLGDRLYFWSEGDAVVLPNSRYSFRFTNGQFNLVHGCTGEPGCMDDQYDIGVNGASLEPLLRTPFTTEAYLDGRDPAMRAVREWLSGDSASGSRFGMARPD